MELIVLDVYFQPVAIIESFESVIWTERYCGYGDFEIYTAVDANNLAFLREDNYLTLVGSETVMVIEKTEIVSHAETGSKLIVTGRSAESILDRRIVWEQTALTGGFQDVILTILLENAIEPANPDRAIDNLIYDVSDDPAVTDLTLDLQDTGGYIYDVIRDACESKHLGFKLTLDEGIFTFVLYAGADRSYNQVVNPYVVFSPNFENVINTNYLSNKTYLKTVALVVGSDGTATIAEAPGGAGTGLDRREIYTEANVSESYEGVPLSEPEYLAQLEQKGLETLAVNTHVEQFDGSLDSSRTFEYGKDFFMGDIVQIANEYGNEGIARVVELIRSQSPAGTTILPTFISI